MNKNFIVASSHLASGGVPDLSEVEFGLMVATRAFERWVVRCMAVAGLPDLTSMDVIVMHHVYHRQRPKKLADICFTLNVEDAHIVNYALRNSNDWALLKASEAAKRYSTM